MALQKRLDDHGYNGYHVPSILPKTARGKRSIRKKVDENHMCAFDLLATVAGKLLLEQEDIAREKTSRTEPFDHGSCSESLLGSETSLRRQISCNLEDCKSNGSVGNRLSGHFVHNKGGVGFAGNEGRSPGSAESCDGNTEPRMPHRFDQPKLKEEMDPNPPKLAAIEDPMDLDVKPSPFVTSDSSVEVPARRDAVELAVNRDDDENSSGCTRATGRSSKVVRSHHIGDRRIRKLLASKYWNASHTSGKQEVPKSAFVEGKPVFHSEKMFYARQRAQRCSFKRRRGVFEHRSMPPSERRIDRDDIYITRDNSSIKAEAGDSTSPSCGGVKLSIKSFKVPELFVEIPESATVASLKRTVMEAVMAILGGRLRVGVLLQGKKVRDDNKTLLQAGIARGGDMLDNLGFTLEPVTSPPTPSLPHHATEPMARIPAAAHPSDPEPTNLTVEPPLTPLTHFHESDHDSVHTPANIAMQDKVVAGSGSGSGCSMAIVSIPPLSVEALAAVPLRKSRRAETVQRRIRRPFSVSEVEALVQAVEKLGTGRWRDVKLRAFDDVKHRTYVDLKDKWKTLVHTARISPQQRRGEPVPQELLDRVLSAHAYWTQQQAKLQVKPPPAEPRRLLCDPNRPDP